MFTSFIFMTLNYLPWLAIGAMGALAWYTRKNSKTLVAQAAGAAAYVTFGVGRWIILDMLLIRIMHAGEKIITPVGYLFSFLSLVALVTFALGYCLERFAGRKLVLVSATSA